MVVFSVFNIGTGHTQSEPNNTMKALYDDCNDATSHKYINDGPTGGRALTGGGMNAKRDETMAAIKNALPVPDRVNLAGHSRGAILCHMLAHAIFADPQTRYMEVSLALIDPVHMSKMTHEGAEGLDSNPKLLAYQAIIMENENTRLWGGPDGKQYPFNFVDFYLDDEEGTSKKVYYINMPGTHGSGTQALTNPIGKVVRELIANFMRKRGTSFRSRKKQPIEMCDLFAQIHLQNPLNQDRSMRKIFNDKGKATTHDLKNTKWQSMDGRDLSVRAALMHNQMHQNPNFQKRSRLPDPRSVPYFINEKHAKFFSRAFPLLWTAVKPMSPGHISQSDYLNEMAKMAQFPGLGMTSYMVDEMLEGKIG